MPIYLGIIVNSQIPLTNVDVCKLLQKYLPFISMGTTADEYNNAVR